MNTKLQTDQIIRRTYGLSLIQGRAVVGERDASDVIGDQ